MKTSDLILTILGFIVFSALLVVSVYLMIFVDIQPSDIFLDWMWSVISIFFILDGIRRIKNDI